MRCARCGARALYPNWWLEIWVKELIASSRQRARHHHLTWFYLQKELCSYSDTGNQQIDILGITLSENAITADIASVAPALSGAYNPLFSAALGPNPKFPHLHPRWRLGRKMPKAYRVTRNHLIRTADFKNSMHFLLQPLVTPKLPCASRPHLLDIQKYDSKEID